MSARRILVSLTWVLALVVFALNMTAQERGTIRGVIEDQSGGTVPEAKVTATDVATGVATSAATTGAGVYNIPQLHPGTYRVEVEKAGFKRAVRENVVVGLEATVGLDVTLEVGAPNQVVAVTGLAPILNTENSEVNTSVPPKAMVDLPLTAQGGRAPINFMFLAPGALGNSFNTYINGGQTFADELEMDGLSLQSGPWLNTGRELTMPPEAIEEATLTGATTTAESSSGGGILRFTTRGGTNQLHGNFYEFFNNTIFDARGFFAASRGITHQNEWGGSTGGPIYIPHVYNGRDRTFFFFNLNYFKLRPGPNNSLYSVPTAAMRQGDLSAIPLTIYDPATTAPNGAGGYTRTAFPGNVIPQDRISTVSGNMMNTAYVPLPTIGTGFFNNYPNHSVGVDNRHDFTMRFDERISDKQSVTAVINHRNDVTDNLGFIPGPAGDNFIQPLYQTNLRFAYDYIFTPHINNHVTVGLNRQINPYNTTSAGMEWGQKLGLKGIYNGAFPAVNMSPYVLSGTGGTGDSVTIFPQNVIPAADTVSIVSGAHTIKFGVGLTKLFIDALSQNGNGIWNFGPNETAFPGMGNTTGFPFASFLLGQVDSASILVTNNVETKARVTDLDFFVQDDIKIRPSFTLNLGVRWDMFSPFRDANNVYSVMDPAIPNPAANGYPGALVFAGYGAGEIGSKYLPGDSETEMHNFGPHLGIAWNFKPRWVARAGYSLAYFAPAVSLAGNLRSSATGYQATPSFNSTNEGITPAFDWDNGFPAFTPPPFINAGYLVGPGLTNQIWDWHSATTAPYRQEWSLNVQRQLANNTMIDVGYVGSKGTHLATGVFNQNQVNSSYLSLGSLLTDSIFDPAVVAAGFKPPYASFEGSLAQALRPFPQYGYVGTAGPIGGSNLDAAQIGNSTFHSLQIKLEKKYSNGIYLLSSFTWSKELTDSPSEWGGFFGNSGRDYYNRKLEKGLAGNDVSWRSVSAFTYELPVGPGKHFAGTTRGVAGKFLAGWQLNGILQYQAANPLTVTVNDTLPIFNATNLPNRLPSVPVTAHACGGFNPATDLFLNVNAFEEPAPYTIGNAPVGLSARGCPFLDENLGLMKRTPINERVNIEFRAEFFNVFNRVQFGTPGNNVSAPFSFGQIGGQANAPRQGQLVVKINY